MYDQIAEQANITSLDVHKVAKNSIVFISCTTINTLFGGGSSVTQLGVGLLSSIHGSLQHNQDNIFKLFGSAVLPTFIYSVCPSDYGMNIVAATIANSLCQYEQHNEVAIRR